MPEGAVSAPPPASAPAPERVLVIDDDHHIQLALCEILKREGLVTRACSSGEEGLAALDEFAPDLALVDLNLPGIDGLEVLKRVRALHSDLPLIMITAYGTVDKAVEAIKAGAHDYLGKPFKIDDLRSRVNKALEMRRLRREVLLLRAQVALDGEVVTIIGASPAMRRVLETVQSVGASASTTVLLEGETGTGKELVARAIHQASSRAGRRFVEINCAALTETLLEAELFGYEAGAFTGAAPRGKPGLFEVAHGGTMFLDEIGEMSLALQAKLLRVLQEKTFTKVGGTNEVRVDVRIVASTNRNLEEEVQRERFRKDLFYRLSVVPLRLPPLRERREDIPLLARHFLSYFNRLLGRQFAGFTPEAEALLLAHGWPGNVRELKNAVERSVLLDAGELIGTRFLLPGLEKAAAGAAPPPGGEDLDLQAVEKRAILRALEVTAGRRSEAARLLGINRSTLYNKLRSYSIDPGEETN